MGHCSHLKLLAHGLLQQMSPAPLTDLDWVGPLLLDAMEIRRVPPSIPGVYMLMAFASKTGKYGSLYCGQTNDLQVRLMQHHSSATTANGFKTLRTQITPYFTVLEAKAINM